MTIKLQRGIVTLNDEEVHCICDVSDPKNIQPLVSFHKSWNNKIMADTILNLIVEGLKD